jgi:hypothetical protein
MELQSTATAAINNLLFISVIVFAEYCEIGIAAFPQPGSDGDALQKPH